MAIDTVRFEMNVAAPNPAAKRLSSFLINPRLELHIGALNSRCRYIRGIFRSTMTPGSLSAIVICEHEFDRLSRREPLADKNGNGDC